MQWKWYAVKKSTWYAFTHPHKRNYPIPMHRLILNTPKGMLTDHKDGDGLNNQKSNLRVCNHSQNNSNRKVRVGKCGYMGVKLENRWRNPYYYAWIRGDGRQIYLGIFKTPEDAARAYDEAAKKYHGEFANLNFKE